MIATHYIKTLYQIFLGTMSLFLCTHTVWGQSSLEVQQNVYQQAMLYQDYQVAKNAVYTMMALAPHQQGLKDTLADVYFQAKDYHQCIKVCNDILQQHHQNLYVREIKAISLRKLQDIKGSVQEYEELFKQSNLLSHAYYLMNLQYQLKRYGECENLIKSLLAHQKIETVTIQVLTQLAHEPFQTVLLKATFLNMLGVIAMDMDNNQKALQYFEQAVKVSPHFLLAQNNLLLMKTRLSQQHK